MPRIDYLKSRLAGFALLTTGLSAVSGIGCASSDLTAPGSAGSDTDRAPASQIDLPTEGDGSGDGDAPTDTETGGGGAKSVDSPASPESGDDAE